MKCLLLWLMAAVSLFAQTPPAAAPPAAPAAPAAREPGLYATLRTTQGVIVVKLFEKEAPATVKNFVALAKGGKPWRNPKTGQMVKTALYPGTIFHRVIPGFMIQGGDPTGTGMGDPGFVIPDEFSPNLKFDVPGRLAMANAGPHTSNCQFFITEVPTPHLNGLHTIFGQVAEGQDVVAKIARVPRDANDKPRTPVRLVSITIKREGPPPVTAHPAVKKTTTKKAVPTTKKTAAKPAAKKTATK